MATDKSDDVAILDVTSDNDDDQSPLLSDTTQQNGSVLLTPNVDQILVPSIGRYRLTNILRVVLLIEFLTMLTIWLAGIKYYLIYFISKKIFLNR
jgi:hypothetical protein